MVKSAELVDSHQKTWGRGSGEQDSHCSFSLIILVVELILTLLVGGNVGFHDIAEEELEGDTGEPLLAIRDLLESPESIIVGFMEALDRLLGHESPGTVLSCERDDMAIEPVLFRGDVLIWVPSSIEREEIIDALFQLIHLWIREESAG